MKPLFNLFAAASLFVASGTAGLAQEAPFRIAVAGVTHDHLNGVVPIVGKAGFDIVGIWEENDAYRNHNVLTGKVPADRFFKDLEEMLDKTRPEAVVAYGSILDHMEVVEACAPRHIHVMVEKPLATTFGQAQRMAALAREHGILVLTNYETSWYATNHRVKALVEEGTIGKIFRINVYDGHRGPKEIGCSQKFLDWLTDPVLNGGGAVIDFGCYGANLATWLLGGQEPTRVYAVLQHNKPEAYPKVDDDATILLEYPGTTVQVMASWCWPMDRKDMYVYGDKGSIYQMTGTKMQVQVGNEREEFSAPALETPYDNSFEYLKAAVRGRIQVGPADLASIENNLTVVRILEAAIESAKKGQAVKLIR